MLKGLVDRNSKVTLMDALIEDLAGRVEDLGLEESAVLFWSVGKIDRKGRMGLLIRLFKRIGELLQPKESETPIVVKLGGEEETEVESGAIVIKPTTISMILSSMSSLSIVDQPLLKRLTSDAIRPNLPSFSATALCTYLIALHRLGFRNKRDTVEIYKEIRSREKELEVASI
jgi:hypothetical protein